MILASALYNSCETPKQESLPNEDEPEAGGCWGDFPPAQDLPPASPASSIPVGERKSCRCQGGAPHRTNDLDSSHESDAGAGAIWEPESCRTPPFTLCFVPRFAPPLVPPFARGN